MNRHLKHSRLGASMMALALASCSITAAGTATADNPTGASAPRAPVQYRVKEKSLIGNDVHEAGAVVSYAGLPADNLEPLCDEGRARAAEYVESNAKRVKAMIAANTGESPVGDPEKFMAAFTKALAEERAEHAAQMAKMVELQQQSATQLAEAAKNMALLAAAITSQAAAPAAPAETVAAATDIGTAGETKDAATGETGTTSAKRTKG